MPLSRDDIREAYRVFLLREVESEEMIDWYLRKFDDVWSVLKHIRSSPEFTWRSSAPFHENLGMNFEEFMQSRSYRVEAEAEAGFVVDFIGRRTRSHYWEELEKLDGRVAALTFKGTPGADPVEWIGLTRAVERAEGRFSMIELGAGWGPWIAAGGILARRKGIEDVRLGAVEADDVRFGLIAEHLEDNGLAAAEARLFHGIVAPQSGWAQFPVLEDSAHDMGPAAIFDASEPPEGRIMDQRGLAYPYARKRAFSLEEIFGEEKKIDVVHFDVQGAELEILESATELVTERCSRLIVGTHSREIEWGVARLLMEAGWALENERPCSLLQGQFGPASDLDGTQVWRNPKFVTPRKRR